MKARSEGNTELKTASECLQRKKSHDPHKGHCWFCTVRIPRVYLLQFCDAHGVKLAQERTVKT